MELSSINIHPVPHTECPFLRLLIFGVCDSQAAAADKMGCEAAVRVGRVVCITIDLNVQRYSVLAKRCNKDVRAVSPGKNVRETPGADLGFRIFARR